MRVRKSEGSSKGREFLPRLTGEARPTASGGEEIPWGAVTRGDGSPVTGETRVLFPLLLPLESMERKCSTRKEKDWNKLIQYVLFAEQLW